MNTSERLSMRLSIAFTGDSIILPCCREALNGQRSRSRRNDKPTASAKAGNDEAVSLRRARALPVLYRSCDNAPCRGEVAQRF
jgi:hypothetical protein